MQKARVHRTSLIQRISLIHRLSLIQRIPLGPCGAVVLLLLAWGIPATPLFAAAPESDFVLVPEMETPPQIVVQPHRQQAVLQDEADGLRGLALLEAQVRKQWSQIREIDIEALSRHQLEATRGWRLPADPGDWVGHVMAHDQGRWYLELRGPRLPANFDIVYRYLHIYASFDPVSGSLDNLTVTIRGWVLE